MKSKVWLRKDVLANIGHSRVDEVVDESCNVLPIRRFDLNLTLSVICSTKQRLGQER